ATALETLARARVDSVAVCYLHAYRNPRHERLTARALARRLRGVYVSLSSVVLPQIKEYERIWTTVVNAYVGPALARYLNALRARLAARGYRGDVLIMQSHGGVAPIRESARLAAGAVLSGPAGGIAAGRYAARLLEEGSLITFDMGGTSTDIALLQRGEPSLTGEKTVGIARIALPSLDIHTLGAGGGSAGLHVTEVARLLEIRRVVIPNVAAVLSAWGMLATDLRYELVRSHVSEVSRLAPATLRRLFAAMEADGRKRLGVFDGPVSVRRSLDMRYGEQIFEIPVSLDGVNLDAANLLDEIVARFHRRHE